MSCSHLDICSTSPSCSVSSYPEAWKFSCLGYEFGFAPPRLGLLIIVAPYILQGSSLTSTTGR